MEIIISIGSFVTFETEFKKSLLISKTLSLVYILQLHSIFDLRLRLRESGGCAVFVNVLTTPLAKSMHDRVINSLLQFMYDNHSLNVLMSAGLIPSLVAFVEQHLKTIEEKKVRFFLFKEPMISNEKNHLFEIDNAEIVLH